MRRLIIAISCRAVSARRLVPVLFLFLLYLPQAAAAQTSNASVLWNEFSSAVNFGLEMGVISAEFRAKAQFQYWTFAYEADLETALENAHGSENGTGLVDGEAAATGNPSTFAPNTKFEWAEPFTNAITYFESPFLLAGAVKIDGLWSVLNSFDARGVRQPYSSLSYKQLVEDLLDLNPDLDGPALSGSSLQGLAQRMTDLSAQRSGDLIPATFGEPARTWGIELDLPGFAGLWASQTISGDAEGWSRVGFGFDHQFLVGDRESLAFSLQAVYSRLDGELADGRETDDWWLDRPLLEPHQVFHLQSGMRFSTKQLRAGVLFQAADAVLMDAVAGGIVWFGFFLGEKNVHLFNLDLSAYAHGKNWIDTYGKVQGQASGSRLEMEIRPSPWLEVMSNSSISIVSDAYAAARENFSTLLSLSLGPDAFSLRSAVSASIADLSTPAPEWTVDIGEHASLGTVARFSSLIKIRLRYIPDGADRSGLSADLGFLAGPFASGVSFGFDAPNYFYKGWGEARDLDLRCSADLSLIFSLGQAAKGEKSDKLRLSLGISTRDDTNLADFQAIKDKGFFSVFSLSLGLALNP